MNNDTGMLRFYDDSKRSLTDKVLRAVAHFNHHHALALADGGLAQHGDGSLHHALAELAAPQHPQRQRDEGHDGQEPHEQARIAGPGAVEFHAFSSG